MADRIYAHHHAVAFLACPGHVPALSTNMNRFGHKRLAWSLDHYHHSNSKTLMAIKHRPQKLELMSSRGFQCCCKHLLPRLWQDLTLKHPLVRSGLLANSESIVSEPIRARNYSKCGISAFMPTDKWKLMKEWYRLVGMSCQPFGHATLAGLKLSETNDSIFLFLRQTITPLY